MLRLQSGRPLGQSKQEAKFVCNMRWGEGELTHASRARVITQVGKNTRDRRQEPLEIVWRQLPAKAPHRSPELGGQSTQNMRAAVHTRHR